MPKLHELLAIESNLENQSNKLTSDLHNTFEKKRHLFEEKRISFLSNSEADQSVVVEQQSDLQTTVIKELKLIRPFIAKSLDASYQVSEANTQARGDVILENGTVILKALPATTLLELEKRVVALHGLLTAIPTLDPAKGTWFLDAFCLVFSNTPGRTKLARLRTPFLIATYYC